MPITELEGAILCEIHHRGNQTAFRVRRAFLESPSLEWSASKGAVYPAIRRLTERGLIHTEILLTSPRASQLRLTDHGVAALEGWATDANRAIGVGLDPFRLRSGAWAHVAPSRLRLCLEQMRDALEGEIETITTSIASLDETERPRAEWALILQRARRDWITLQLLTLGTR